MNNLTNTLTHDETYLLCIYQKDTRAETMATLFAMQEYLDEAETELKAMSDSLLAKLMQMTDKDFSELELYPDFDLS